MSLLRNKVKKAKQVPQKYHVKKGDTVMVVTGKDKGKTGTVKQVLINRGRVVVEGLNMVKKAVRPNPMIGLRGGLVEMEAPIAVSNVMLYDAKNSKATRVKRETVENKRVRVAVKTGEHLDD